MGQTLKSPGRILGFLSSCRRFRCPSPIFPILRAERLTACLEGLLAVIFPPQCPFCSQMAPELAGHGICRSCWQSMVPLQPPLCDVCGLPLAARPADKSDGRIICGDCTVHPPVFRGARSYGRFEGLLRETVHLFKFQGRRDLAAPLGTLLFSVRNPPAGWDGLENIVAVPLHSQRMRERGYNQAELLALQLARHLKIPVLRGVLIRFKPTLPQSGLTDRQRQENIRGAFRVRRPEKIRGRQLLLVDDVFTTGATLIACSQVLIEAGAAGVWILTLARSLKR